MWLFQPFRLLCIFYIKCIEDSFSIFIFHFHWIFGVFIQYYFFVNCFHSQRFSILGLNNLSWIIESARARIRSPNICLMMHDIHTYIRNGCLLTISECPTTQCVMFNAPQKRFKKTQWNGYYNPSYSQMKIDSSFSSQCLQCPNDSQMKNVKASKKNSCTLFVRVMDVLELTNGSHCCIIPNT